MDKRILKDLRQSLSDLKYVRTNNPMGILMQTMTPEQKKEALRESAAATSVGFALPGIGFGAAGPAIFSLPTMLPEVIETQTQKNKNKNDMNNRVVKDEEPAGAITYNNTVYTPFSYVDTKGDTIRGYSSISARPGRLWKITYATSPGQTRGESKLTTQNESGELQAGREYRISRTSDYGKALDEIFANSAMSQPITKDYSKATGLKKLFYKILGYKEGGSVNYLNYIQ